MTTRGVSVLTTMLAPIAAAMVVLARPVVHIVYERGSFDDADAARTVAALVAYAPGLVALGARDVALRGLYGLQDRWRPAFVGAVGVLVNVVGDITLAPLFGVAGLGAATTLSFAASAVVAIVILDRAHEAVAVRGVVGGVARNAVAVVPAALVMFAIARVGQLGEATHTLTMLAVVTVAAGAGMLVHLAVLRVLGAPEVIELTTLARQVAGRIRRSR